MSDCQPETFEYFCTRCKIKIVAGIGYVKCPECKSGSSIVDYGRFPAFDNVTMGGCDFNWNKK